MTKTETKKKQSKEQQTRQKSEPSTMARRARLRPADYDSLSGETQWEIDKSLGILDWDGT